MLDIDPAKVVRKGRLQPGRMFLVDTDAAAGSSTTRRSSATSPAEHPYDEWLHAGLIHLEDLPEREHIVHTPESVLRRQQTFGYTEEELRILLAPMARTGAEPIGSMGTDTPDRGAVRPAAPALRLLHASCSPRSPTRRWTRSARSSSPRSATTIGPEGNLLDRDAGALPPGRAAVPGASTTTSWPRSSTSTRDGDLPGLRVGTSSRACTASTAAARRCASALEEICAEVTAAIARRRAVHRAVRPRLRRRPRADPVAAADRRRPPPPHPGEDPHPGRADRRGRRRPRGAPRRAADRLRRGRGQPLPGDGDASRTWPAQRRSRRVAPEKAVRNLIKALGKGVLKVMCKMGISTVASYRGAQVFEAIGLAPGGRRPLLHRHDLAARRRRPRRDRRGGRAPARAWRTRRTASRPRTAGSTSAASTSGAARASRTCSTPRRSSGCSTRPAAGRYDVFKRVHARVDEQSERLMTLRGLFAFKDGVRGRPCRSTRSSRSARSSSGSRPARCRTAPSRRRRTRRWRSR